MKISKLSEALYEDLRAAIEEGSAIPTLATGRLNRVTCIALEGVYIATEV